MNISAIGSSNQLSALSSLSAATDASTEAAQNNTPTQAAPSKVSKPGELMAKLSQLQQQDPAKFSQVTRQIADELKSAASTASGPQAQFLAKLSDNFAQASSSGDLSSLQPPARGPEHGGPSGAHHHQGGGHPMDGEKSGMDAVFSNTLAEVNQALSTSTPSAASATV